MILNKLKILSVLFAVTFGTSILSSVVNANPIVIDDINNSGAFSFNGTSLSATAINIDLIDGNQVSDVVFDYDAKFDNGSFVSGSFAMYQSGSLILDGEFGDSTMLIEDSMAFGPITLDTARFISSSSIATVYSDALGFDIGTYNIDVSSITNAVADISSTSVKETDIVLTSVPSTGSTVTMLGMGLTIIGLVVRRKK